MTISQDTRGKRKSSLMENNHSDIVGDVCQGQKEELFTEKT